MHNFPWEFQDDLTLYRLQLIANELRATRRETIALHDPAGGDTPWSLGCRAFARSATQLTRRAGRDWPWLKILHVPQEFVFSIGDVPMRFFRGDSDYLDPRQRRVADSEHVQLLLTLGDDEPVLIWRLMMETSPIGEAGDIVLIGSTPEGAIECRYVIPESDQSVRPFDPSPPPATASTELPPPVVKPRQKKQTRIENV